MVTQVRTVDFLPEVFRTETNEQFLGATLDILTSQPELQRIGGYIGNKYGYGINPNDKYIVEPTQTRSDYQLQPSVVFTKPDTQTANDYINYTGIVNALSNAGANTSNHERLFESQFYSWDPFIDLDKAVNYAQYYWLPLGPDAIPLTGSINVTAIQAAATYTSPNDVVFTNGLKVLLPGTTTPSSYANNQYYVEGVGTRIVLRPVSDYSVPEAPGAALYNPWDTAGWDTDSWDATLYVSVRPEYITISRNSDDMNAWTRANRWFHQDVLDTTTQHLGSVTSAVGNTITRAARPIIEFRGNLQLYNSGSTTVGSVTVFDTVTTDAATQVAGQASYTVDGQALLSGDRVIFAADSNDVARSTIYTVSFAAGVIVLTPTTVVTVDNAQTWVLRGTAYGGTSWRYNVDTANWMQSQQKTELNQTPLYDVVSLSGISYGNALYYSGTSFVGSALFTYTPNTSGVDDPVLGFPITYSGVNNIGDISFTVNFNTETFSYIDNSGNRVTVPINSGYVVQNGSSTELLTGWIPAAAPSVQYQVFQYTVTAENTAAFDIDVPLRSPSVWAPAIVYVNDELLDRSSYTVTVSAGSSTITLNTAVSIDTRVTILALSDTPSVTAYYEVPVNLQNNPFNGDVTRVDVGDLRNQYRSIYSNAPNLVGPLWGDNNYHDLPSLNKYGTAIIQNSASLVLPGVFLRKSEADYFAALDYSAQQYQLYKDLLIDLAGTNDYSIEQTPAQVLDSVIYEITTIRKNSTAFFWTDMLPSGSPYAVNNYNVGVATNSVYYNLSRVYDYNSANYYGVVVYVSRSVGGIQRQIQLLRGIDYTVSSTSPTVYVHTQLQAGDVVTVREYNQTYGTYCPSTPTSLGLYPATIPHIMIDNGARYIVGHDGSINRLYGEYNEGYLQDFRDIALYEFEKRVYNNIKISSALPLIYDEVNPGQWRVTDYNYNEIQDIYRTAFLNWVGSNRIDYKTQQYNLADRFTYNYNQSSNKLNSDCSVLLQGYWRGIYKYTYDTENPAATPWQMLGYANKPTWWDTHYSWTDSGKRTALIDALKFGKTGEPPSTTINPLYARPQIESVLPVDSLGALLNPFDAVVGNYNRLTFNRNWVVGDGSPVEATYWKSSAWPFAVMRLLALTKPAKFFNLFADRDRYAWDSQFGQYLYNGRQHFDPRTLTVYGNGTAVHSYVNWIVDYINVRGVNGHDTVRSLVSNTDVRLTYNLAGFSSKEHLQFYIERATPNSKNTSLLVPDENYAVLLYNNVPEDVVRYSSIIVQRTELGWTVWGNSQNTAYFTVSVPQPNGNTSTVSAGGATVRVYNDYSTETVTVPYGTLFYSVQALSEFIRSYGQHLIDMGVVFDNIYDNVVYDWIRMVEEFLAWSQQSWTVGSTIALNPNAKTFVVNRPGLVVQPLTVYRDNFVLNQNLLPVQQQNSTVYRNNTAFTVKIINDGDTVGYTNLHLSSIEHAVVFDNNTSFNDLLYNTVTGLRQNRLLLKGYKTANWQGYVNANGFILSEDNIVGWQPNAKYAKGSIVTYKDKYWVAPQLIEPTSVFPQNLWQSIDRDRIKLGMLPNPSTASAESALYYNSNVANLELDADLLSFSLIGYRPRDYLAAADLSDITQINVYKNIVREKGTYALANSFRFAQFDQGRIEYDIYENWALHTADFGAVLGSNYVEALLDQHALTGNPTTVAFSNTTAVADAQQTVYLNQLVGWQRPPLDAHFLPPYTQPYTAERGLPSAGYVNSDDVTNSVYQYSDTNNSTLLLDTLVNNTLWVARWNSSWNVFSALSVGTQIASVQNNQNGTMTVTFTGFHGLNTNDPFAIVSFDSEVDGFYTVSSVNNVFAVTVTHTMNPSTLLLTGVGVALKLQSRRLAQPSDVAAEYLPFNGLNSRRVWVDNDSNGDWSVWRCTPSFTPVQFPNTLNAGGSVAYSSSVGYLLGNSNTWTVYQSSGIGGTLLPFGVTPGFGASIVIAGAAVFISSNDYVYYYRSINGGLVQTQQIDASNVTAIAASNDGSWLYVAVPGSIRLYRLDTATNTYSLLNSITQPLDAIGWGYAIATSTDGSRLFVGAPQQSVSGLQNSGALYTYSRLTERFLITVSSPTITLSAAPPGGVVDVYINGVLTTAYTLVGSTLTLNSSPAVGTVVSVSTASIFEHGATYSPQPRLGGRYGHSVATNRWGADVVVGAPYEAINIGGATTVEGSVYRYTNSGQRYGVVACANPNVIAGDQIWINGYRVLWESVTTDAYTIATAINTQTPTNITASVNDNTITITLYDNTAETLYNLIDIVGSSAVLDRLNIDLYSRTQSLYAYNRPQSAQYGWSVAMNERDGLIVGAPAAPRIAATTFDYSDDNNNNDTVFDNGATTFVDSFANTGLAYLYEYMPAYNESTNNPGAYTFAQYLSSTVPTDSTQPRWGSSLAWRDGVIVVGSQDYYGSNSGQVITYSSNSGNAWYRERTPLPRVDINRVNNLCIYNRLDNTTLGHLDYCDPLQGKLLGAIASNLDYIAANDPASYGTNALSWGAEHIGRTWFDTTDYRALDYNQNDLQYNAKHWGRAFPGSIAPVYVWVESTVAPLSYTGEGVPYSFENYAEASVYDRNTNSTATRYYYWVRGINALPPGKTLSTVTLSAYLLDAPASGIAFVAPLTTNAVALYNSADYIQSNTSVLHIGYGNAPKGDTMHTLWDLIKSGDPNSFLGGLPNTIRSEPAGAYLKYIDSFCGYDVAGQTVPDPRLPPKLRGGISFRPRQTMFMNRREALRNFIDYANRVMLRYPITETVTSLDFLTRRNTVNGSVLHSPVNAATTVNLIAGYSNGISGVGAKLTGSEPLPAIDGASLSIGARVLVKNQNNALENGIYTVTNISAPWVLTRSTDFDGGGSGVVQNGDAVRVLGGTQANTAWAVQTPGTLQFGVSLVLFTPVSTADIPTISRPIYDVRDYWTTVDWWADGYSSSTKPIIEVPVYNDLQRITDRTIITGVNGLFIPLEDGLIARVSSNSAGNAETYVYSSINGWTRIGVENGTIQILSSLYSATYGWDTTTWSNPADRWNRNSAIETRYIIRWINECLYTEELRNERNSSLMLMFDYIASEISDQRNYGQWLAKTSFIDVSHKIRNLSQYKLYQRDNTEFLTGFINEVKPYHVVIKDFIYKYTGEDVYQGNVTDFDLPAVYNSSTGRYSTPQLVYTPTYETDQYTTTATIWTEQQYSQWFQNWGLHFTDGSKSTAVASLAAPLTAGNNTLVLNTVAGFANEGTIQIDNETLRYSGINRSTNTLLNLLRGFDNTAAATHTVGSTVRLQRTAFTVVDGARGYNSTATVTVTTPASFPAPRSTATTVVSTASGAVSSVRATNIGSGYGGNPTITVSGSTVAATFVGSQVNLINNTITITSHPFQPADPVVFSSNTNRYGLTVDSYYYVGVIDDNTIALYLDRNSALTLSTLIWVDGLPQLLIGPMAKTGSLDNERVRLSNSGTATATLTVTARVAGTLAADPLRSMRVVMKFDRVSYRADLSGTETAAERIERYYQPTVNMPGRILSQLMSGTEYPHATITPPAFTDTTTVLDSVLDASSFSTTDTLYTMSGGSFPDGYAPEELVAAYVSDALQITVTSNDLPPTTGSGYVTGFSAASGTISTTLPVYTNAVYTNVPTITASGSGAGCRVNIRIVVEPGVSAISGSGSNQNVFVSPGYPDTTANYTGYNVGDTLTIKGSSVGGVDDANDITITVGSIGGRTWKYTQTVNRFGIPVVYAGADTSGSVLGSEYYDQSWYSKAEGWNAGGGWDASKPWDSGITTNVTLTTSTHPAAVFLRTNNQ